MAEVVLTTLSPIEELAVACQQCANVLATGYVDSESEASSRGNFLMLNQDDDDGDHDTY